MGIEREMMIVHTEELEKATLIHLDVYGGERQKSWVSTGWQSWLRGGDMLIMFIKKGKLQWREYWKESIRLFWTCQDSDTVGDVQETVVVVSRAQ